jgi:hypothetical protein
MPPDAFTFSNKHSDRHQRKNIVIVRPITYLPATFMNNAG